MYTKVQTSLVEPPVQQPASDQAQPAAPGLRARNIRRGSLAASGLAALTLVLAACGRWHIGLWRRWLWRAIGSAEYCSRDGRHC